MHLPGLRRLLRRAGLPWLLGLALLWPLAQSAAAGHALSHVAAEGSQDDEAGARAGLHLGHCELCLVAAAVSADGLPSAAPACGATAPGHVGPAAPQLAGRAAPCPAPYRSRAPPTTPA